MSIPQGLPMDRDAGPFAPPSEITRLRETRPVSPMHFPDGHEGWLVTGYEAARQLLADTRFSSRQDLGVIHVPFETPSMPPATEPSPTMPGVFVAMDPPDHTRLRRKLTGAFTVKRMKNLEEHIIEIVERQLDEMAKLTAPVDLVTAFALPVPSLVICEMLGVPYEDRDSFQANSAQFLARNQELDEKMAALTAYLGQLVMSKRANPGEDILSDLASQEDLGIEELVGVAFLLLLAGHETTANMLALGTFALLGNPEQQDELRADPELLPNAVEEILRYLCPSATSFTATPRKTSNSGERRSPRDRLSSSRCSRPTVTRSDSKILTRCTSTARRAATCPSATAFTNASASNWPVSRCVPVSRDCCAASRRSNSRFPPRT